MLTFNIWCKMLLSLDQEKLKTSYYIHTNFIHTLNFQLVTTSWCRETAPLAAACGKLLDPVVFYLWGVLQHYARITAPYKLPL